MTKASVATPSPLNGERAGVRGEIFPKPLDILHRLIGIFSPAKVFIEIQRHYLRGEERWLRACAELAEQFHLPLLATNGVLYAKPSGRQVLDLFTCIRHHTHLDAAGKLLAQNSERHLKDAATMAKLFRDFPQAIDNTVRLADRLQFSLTDLGYEFPRYPVPTSETMDSVLHQANLRRRARALWRHYSQSSPPTRTRTRLNHQTRVRRLLPHRGRHCEILPRERHHGPGPRQRRQQRRLLQPWHYRRRSDRRRVALRAFPQRRPQRLARYRHRPAQWR